MRRAAWSVCIAWGAAACGGAGPSVTEDPEPVYGCTDPAAPNYDPLATVDNGVCVDESAGCTDPAALNYDPLAVGDDGSCLYELVRPGLEALPLNGTCVAPAPEPSVLEVELDWVPALVGTDFTYLAPTALVQSPVTPGVWYLAQQGHPARPAEQGILWRLEEGPSGVTRSPFLVLPAFVFDWEAGVLGLALHPDFASNGDFFVYYTRPTTVPGMVFESVLARFHTDDGVTADPSSQVELVVLPQPNSHHQAGAIEFGPDGLMYVTFGDGGGYAVSNGLRAQDPHSFYGTMIRIDVDGGDPYAIPPDNPFADGVDGAPEVIAYGFRNPWRFTFHPDTGDIWVGDVGLDSYEEIDVISTFGGNYGWPHYEGELCRAEPCNASEVTFPLVSMAHPDLGGSWNAILGGQFYTSDAIPSLQGTFLFGDYTQTLWALTFDEADVPTPVLLYSNLQYTTGLVKTPDHEIYVLSTSGIFQLREGASAGENTFPQTLSATGCFDPADTTQAGPAMVPYDINAPLWSDGTDKGRWFVVPDGQKVTVDADGDLHFPVGSLLFKHFAHEGRLLETRMMVHHEDVGWAGYSYQWNEDQTDAVLLHDGLDVTLSDGFSWSYPSRAACFSCHTESSGRTLGPELSQLNRSATYPSTGITANQLLTLDHVGLFEGGLPGAPADLPALASPTDPSADAEARARAYLHTNCSHCHRPGTGNQAGIDLRAGIPTADMGVCGELATLGDLGLADPVLVRPGDPDGSVLYRRVADTTGEFRMPPLATRVTDPTALASVRAWIEGLESCP